MRLPVGRVGAGFESLQLSTHLVEASRLGVSTAVRRFFIISAAPLR